MEKYDVCIVGSGAAGGMAAKVLTEAGAKVVMLEAGPMWDNAVDSAGHTWSYESPRRGAAIPERQFGEFDGALGGWTLEGEPYTSVGETDWDWFRSRMLGGKTNHWGRISLRFGPDDFKPRTLDGKGYDWPISYEDVEPYYDKVDRLVGIFGSEENFPNAPDGIFMPPPEPRCYELLIKEGGKKVGMPFIPSRLSIITEPLNGRAPCHYCAHCNRGCRTYSNFSSPHVLIQPARQTGRLELIPNAMVREVTTDREGRATGVSYVDTESMREYKVKADIVVLGASACESARLLMNSTSPRHPNGLANSSDAAGKFLMDSTGTSVAGLIPDMMNMPAHNCDGVGGAHLYAPWWLDNQDLDFSRGYHVEIGGGRYMPSYGVMGGVHNYNAIFQTRAGNYGQQFKNDPQATRRGGGYGKSLKNDYRRLYGATVGFAGRGETIAREDNYCEIDPNVVDKFGIPVLRFHYTWSDDEIKQVKHMQETFRELIDAMGGEPLSPMPSEGSGYGISTPGEIIHEVGVARMGNDPKTSVLNRYNQSHDVDNLFVMDGAAFVSSPHKNCTWTILALAMRASEYLVEERRKGNL